MKNLIERSNSFVSNPFPLRLQEIIHQACDNFAEWMTKLVSGISDSEEETAVPRMGMNDSIYSPIGRRLARINLPLEK